MRITAFGEALRDGEDRPVGRIAFGDFAPVERSGDAGIGEGPHGVSRAGGAVLGVLVVVEEDAVALLFPPLRRRERRDTPFDRAGESESRAADFGEGPARLDANVDVHAARAAGLGPSAQAHFAEE